MQLNHYDTPCLWVDLDIMESNIQHLAGYFKSRGLEWRPHTKGIKIPEIAKLVINTGAFGVTCAKLSEAELMTAAGVKNILIANQVVGEQKIERLCQLSRINEIIVAVDHLETIQLMNRIAEKFAVTLEGVVHFDDKWMSYVFLHEMMSNTISLTKILRSVMVCSTWFLLIISAFLSTLRAYSCPVSLFLTSMTFP